MSTEIELKLALTPKAAAKLARHPLLARLATQKQRLLNTYYDTATLDLHTRRIAVRFRKKGWQWLCTVKTAEPASGGLAQRSEWETEASPGHFDFEQVDNPALRSFLEARREALEPVFTTDFRRQSWQVPYGQSLIELAVDRGTIESRGRHAPICEIELELLTGKIEDIFALARHLQADCDLRPAIASKAERGYKLFLDEALRPFKAKVAPISGSMTPVEAFRSIALGCLEHFQRNEAGLVASDDPEFTHQARVALRRLRSAIKLFAPVLPGEFVRTYGRTWQMLASALGGTRNWDVFITETLPPAAASFPDDPELRRIGRQAAQQARLARKAVTALLTLREYPRLLLEFTAAVHRLHAPLATSLPAFAREQIARHARQAKKPARKHATLSLAEHHKMRLAFKKLRYTLEFFSPLLGERSLAIYLEKLARLQDELGAINDQLTALTLIEALPGKCPDRLLQGWLDGRSRLQLGHLSGTLGAWSALEAPLPARPRR